MAGGSADGSWHTYRIGPDEHPAEAVVMAVSAVTNERAEALNQLYDTLDPDALDSLLSEPRSEDGHVRVEFTYGGCEVVVEDRTVRVRER